MKYILSLVLSLMLVACGTGNYPQAQPRLEPSQTVYRLNAGDTVKVTVFGESDLTGPYVIDSRGMLALPLMGKMDVADQTEQQAAETIASALRKGGYLKNPKVAVETIAMRPFYIIGEVEKGGKFPYQSGLTVYQAVAIAGGYTYRADRDDISIRRQTDKGAGTEQRLSGQEDTPVLPGDVIEIGERFF